MGICVSGAARHSLARPAHGPTGTACPATRWSPPVAGRKYRAGTPLSRANQGQNHGPRGASERTPSPATAPTACTDQAPHYTARATECREYGNGYPAGAGHRAR
jgi:hypothetical protein